MIKMCKRKWINELKDRQKMTGNKYEKKCADGRITCIYLSVVLESKEVSERVGRVFSQAWTRDK